MWWVVAAFGWSFRAELGGQFERASHGIANFQARSGPWELALYTDTLQVRYDGSGNRGRWWGAARVQLGAVGLVSTRWVDGLPSPEASQLGFYGGPEGGGVIYLPKGWYVGLQGSLRYYAFAPLAQTVSTAASRPVWANEAVLGWYSEPADLVVRGGVTLSPGTVSPGVHLLATLHPRAPVAPWVEVRAGVAENTDLVTSTRLGGLNPYVVPLAGAGWAEFWVEDYVAVRVGPRLRYREQWLAPVVDGAWFDGRAAWGAGAMAHGSWRGWGLDLGFGLAPELRPAGALASSTYVRVSLDF